MEVDSGATISVLPKRILDDLGLKPVGVVELSDFMSRGTRHRTYLVDIELDGEEFTGVEVVAGLGDTGLLGADVLKSCVVVLDGPREHVTLTAER
jgi:predicted aspartyl protease